MDDLIRGLPSRSGHRREAKKWGKFVLKILIILSILAATVYGVNFLWKKFVVFNQDFRLEKIQFETNGHMTEAEVRKILGLTGEENVLFLDIEGLKEKMKSRADIVKVSINRELPATLVVELEERVPVAWLECTQDNLYGRDKTNGKFVDSSGYIFSYEAELHKRYESSPVIRVAPPMDGHYGSGEWLEGASARQGLSFLRTAKAFINEGIPLVQSLDFVNDWSFVAHFSDGMAITFGLFDHERQLHDLALVMQHARATNRSIKSANMMPVRNMPVVFGNKKDIPIVQAEVVDEEVPPAASREKQASGKPEEPAGKEKTVPDKTATRNNKVEDKEESREKAKSNDSKASATASSRKNSTSKASSVRAAEVVDEDTPAPRKKASAPEKNTSGKKASGDSGNRSSAARNSSGKTSKKVTDSRKKESGKTQAQPQPRRNTSTSNGSQNKSSGSSRKDSRPVPQPPAKKQVEVPSFNW